MDRPPLSVPHGTAMPPAPPAPARNALQPAGGTYTQMQLLDALPAKAHVGRYGAMMSSDFLACETVKARAIRSLPARVLERRDNGRYPAEGHPLNRVLHRPNALMSWGDLVSWAVIRRDVFGTAYIRALRDWRGEVTELRPVTAPVRVEFDKESGTAVYTGQRDDMNGPWTCREDDLVVLKTDISEDGGITGKSIAEKAAEDIGLSLDLTRFYRALLENGNHFKGWLETDQKLTPQDIDAVKGSLAATSGADSAGGTRIFDRGLKYHDVQVALQGMELVEQERFILEKVCRACHVDPHHVHADSGAAATTAAGAEIDFVKNTVLPEVTAIEQAFQPLLDRAVSLGGADSGYRVKVDVNGLLRGDFKTRMEGYRIGVYAGIYTRAWCAMQEDIPWLPGQDKLLQPTAYYMVGDDGEPYVPAQPTQGTSGQSDGVSGRDEKEVADRLRPLFDDARERVAKRAAADGDTSKTRAFGGEVFAPIALAAARCGLFVDVGQMVDEAIGEGARHG